MSRHSGGAALHRPVLLAFSHLRWGFVFQRPQHLLTRAARDWRVLFLEEPVAKTSVASRLERRTTPEGVEVLAPVLDEALSPAERADAVRGLLDGLVEELGAPPDVGWYYTPMALGFSGHLRFDVTVYDCMDELSQFKGAPAELVACERELIGRADVVFTGGRSLYEAKRRLHANVHAFPSSVDVAHFRPARDPSVAVPDDVAGIGKPRIGWFGVIDERTDIDLVDAVARARPDWQIVMIGPVVKIDPATLPRHSNIHWLGMKSYGELPAYLAALDVGWMPFAINEATRFISPTKTPEFLAAGLRVVSTPVRDVVRDWGDAGLVAIAADAVATVSTIEAALAEGASAAWLAKVDAKLGGMSWDRTWDAMRALIVDRAVPRGMAMTAAPPS